METRALMAGPMVWWRAGLPMAVLALVVFVTGLFAMEGSWLAIALSSSVFVGAGLVRVMLWRFLRRRERLIIDGDGLTFESWRSRRQFSWSGLGSVELITLDSWFEWKRAANGTVVLTDPLHPSRMNAVFADIWVDTRNVVESLTPFCVAHAVRLTVRGVAG
jgi:hypothetical protein